MAYSHKIWIDARGGSAKSFGCGSDNRVTLPIAVGVSASNSFDLCEVVVKCYENSAGELSFEVLIDGQEYKRQTYERKAQKFGKVQGFKINGKPKSEKKIKEETEKSAGGFMRMLGVVASLGDLEGFGKKDANDIKGANDWKARMLRAGLGEGLSMPEDWEELSEEEKERRLNGVIKISAE